MGKKPNKKPIVLAKHSNKFSCDKYTLNFYYFIYSNKFHLFLNNN